MWYYIYKDFEEVTQMEQEQLDILLPRHTLEEVLGEEMAKQYRLRGGEDCIYMPVSNGTDILCTCGAVNPVGQVCAACGREPSILSRQEMEALREEAAQRLAREEAQRAEQEAERLEQEACRRRKKRRRIAAVTAAVVGAVAVAGALTWTVFQWAIPAWHYSRAMDALEQKDFRLAHREFTLAGDFRDAPAYLERFYTPVLTSLSVTDSHQTLTEHVYDAAGRRIKTTEVVQQSWDQQGAPVTDEHWVYEQVYDEAGRILVYADWYGKIAYSYDLRGDVSMEVEYNSSGQQETTRLFSYWYDGQGRLKEKKEQCIEALRTRQDYERTEYYAYDGQGNLVWQQETVTYPARSSLDYVATTQWRYDTQGSPVEKTLVQEGNNAREERETWSYDRDGNVLKHTTVISSAADPVADREKTETFTYNSRGDVTKLVTVCKFPQSPGSDYAVTIEQTYNRAGRLVRYTQETAYADSQRYEGLNRTYTRTIRYDLRGRPVEEVRDWAYADPEQSYVETETVTYGSDGMREEVRTVTEMAGKTTETVESYDENGMCWKVEFDGQSRHEYTYAYFYFEDPDQIPTETTRRLVYG